MTNLEVAQSVPLRPIREVAEKYGLSEDDFDSIGKHKGKLTYAAISTARARSAGKLVLVSAVTPTSAGEGKTTTTVGLAQGLNRIGKKAICAIREPALGPVFGIKGGACGGGYSQVLPMEDINLFFNGDFPAIAAAHNLLSALTDSHIHNGNALAIEPSHNIWPRTVDMNDRALRQIVTGLGGSTNSPAREAGFVIVPASEVMAVLCLSRSLADLKERLGRLIAGRTKGGTPITAKDIGASGAMAALLKDAIRPNLVQTIEGDLAIVHGGPFGNIAHGCSSILGTECAMGLAEFTVTEGGFGSDLGGEKFLDIVCPRLGRGPDAIVLVATVRALKHHGFGDLGAGCQNLMRHLSHLRRYGPPVVVSINRFHSDMDEEHALIKRFCETAGSTAVTSDPWGGGGPGCQEVAEAVVAATSENSSFSPSYRSEAPFEQKLETLVREVYGGEGYDLSASAAKDLAWARKNGYGDLPICTAKTQYSLSDDASLINAPSGFRIRVKDILVSAGAGFLVVVCGDIMRMPGLGKSPAAISIDVDDEGRISGLF